MTETLSPAKKLGCYQSILGRVLFLEDLVVESTSNQWALLFPHSYFFWVFSSHNLAGMASGCSEGLVLIFHSQLLLKCTKVLNIHYNQNWMSWSYPFTCLTHNIQTAKNESKLLTLVTNFRLTNWVDWYTNIAVESKYLICQRIESHFLYLISWHYGLPRIRAYGSSLC